MTGVVDVDLEIVFVGEVEGGLYVFCVRCVDDPGFASWPSFGADGTRKCGG